VPASLHAGPAKWPRCADARQRRAYAQALAQAKAAYEQAASSHVVAEQRRKDLLALAQAAHRQSADRERQVRRRHDQMAREFADGKRKAVTDYFRGVLNVQRYPGDFPTGAKVALNPPCERLFHYLGELPALRGGELSGSSRSVAPPTADQ
jgi:hypothetical protein